MLGMLFAHALVHRKKKGRADGQGKQRTPSVHGGEGGRSRREVSRAVKIVDAVAVERWLRRYAGIYLGAESRAKSGFRNVFKLRRRD